MSKNRPTISFCTSCMNRTMHLKQTYIKNLDQFSNHTDVEFVLLNYNSSDDLHEFVQKRLTKYIDSGLLNYYHTVEPEFWDMSHSKNVSHRLGNGDILCNLDADNFIGDTMYECVINNLVSDKTKFMRKRGNGKGGRIAVHREHFYKIGGYDEMFCLGWGHEDMDFNKRLERIGLSRTKGFDFDVIHHPKKIRTIYSRETNMWNSRDIHKEIMIENDRNNKIVCNENGFGQAIVFKNFDYVNPIVLGK